MAPTSSKNARRFTARTACLFYERNFHPLYQRGVHNMQGAGARAGKPARVYVSGLKLPAAAFVSTEQRRVRAWPHKDVTLHILPDYV